MINIEAVKRVLESQGKLDFKPFHFNDAKQEYWAFRTSDNKFHICDNDLKEIDRYDLKSKSLFRSWRFCDYEQKVLFVLERESDYFFLEEGVSITTIQEEQPNNPVRNVWLINDWDGEIVAKDFIGYRYIGKKWIILETTTIEISENDNRYWFPEKKITCYDPNDLFKEEKQDFFYCGSYNDYWDMFYCDGNYYIECRDFYGRDSNPHHFENLIIWFSVDGVLVITIQNNKGSHRIAVYKPAVMIRTAYDYYYGDECLGSHDIYTNYSFEDSSLFANGNVFVLSNFHPNTSSWITINRYGKVGSEICNKGGKIVSVKSDIIKFDSSSWSDKEKKYDFYDYNGTRIAKDISETAKYVVISKSFNSTLFENESDESCITIYKGVMNAQDHSLVIPIKYTNLELFDGSDFFYAIIGENYTDNNGAEIVHYGLLYNNKTILPCNKEEIRSLNVNLFVWKSNNKYGLVSNGMICCECIYDNISIAKSIGRRKKYSHDRYFPALHNYRDYFYTLLQDGNHYGIFVPDWNMVIRSTFNNIIAFVEEKFFCGDNNLFRIKGNDFTFVKDMSGYEYVGGLKNYHLFKFKNGDRNSIDNYKCFLLRNGELEDEDITDAELDDEIEADRDYINWGSYNPVLVLGDESVFYSVKKNIFYDDINSLASYPEPDIDEGYNYERDTYYALGGDDYDQWKENGGDLDGMMEGMGF
ncbi:MAG: hypothetical protein J5965_28815 [Aeriscardovia sp.]|nr:hypothetical protein [Aeriscardovia sp.]